MKGRRFIAGALCPQCGETDRTVLMSGTDGDRRECVSCGYSEKRPDDSPAVDDADAWNRVRVLDKPPVKDDHDL